MFILSVVLSGCAPEATATPDPFGMPLEIDVGTYSVRAGSPTGAVAAVVVVTNTGTNAFTEEWYLSPAGANGAYVPYVRPSAANTSTVLAYVYASSATANPPTNPAPAAGAIRWKHVVTKP